MKPAMELPRLTSVKDSQRVRSKRDLPVTESPKPSIDSLLSPLAGSKRPFSPDLATTHLPKSSCRSLLKASLSTRHRGQAPLERLPIELLDEIFLQCLNLNLPRASFTIGQKLATKHVLTQLVLKTCSAGSTLEYPGDSVTLFPTASEHAKFQSAVLRFRWMTLDFLRQCVPEYFVKTLVRELGARQLRWLGSGCIVTKKTAPLIRQYFYDRMHVSDRQQDDYWEETWEELEPARLVKLAFWPEDGGVILQIEYAERQRGARSHWNWSVLSCMGGCLIPEKLLHGPWTDGKVDFLRIVIQANASIDWLGTVTGEVAEQGLVDAIREGNVKAVSTLLSYHHVQSSNDSSASWSLPPRYWAPVARNTLDIEPRTQHLREAVLKHCGSRDIIELILHHNDRINLEDRVITNEALRQYHADDRWLWYTLQKAASSQNVVVKF